MSNLENLIQQVKDAYLPMNTIIQAVEELHRMQNELEYAKHVCLDEEFKTLSGMFLFNRTDAGSGFWFGVGKKLK